METLELVLRQPMLTRAPLLRLDRLAAAVALALSACQAPDELPPPERIEQRAVPFEPREPVMLAPPAGPAPGGKVAPVIERGTGTFVGAPQRPVTAAITRDAAGEVTLNVVDADVREVVRMVLQDALGANYVIDPAVQGTVTVQTSQPVPAADLAPILDAVLRINGAALVREGDLYKVVPLEQAMVSGATPTIYPLPEAGTPGFGIQVVPLRFISAAEAARLIEPFAPPGGTIQLDPTRNLLLLAGGPAELDTLNDLVATFDVDWLAGMSFGLFPLTSAMAGEVVVELEELFGAAEAGPVEGMVRFLPIERLNAVLVISSQPAYLDRARTWIVRLDQVGEEPQVYVYPVQNGRAADLAGVLSETFGIEAATVGPSDLLAPGMEPAGIESTGFELGESAAEAEAAATADEELGEDARRRRATGRERLGAARPGLGAARAGAERRTPGDLASAFPEGVRIVADETTNSLVIRAASQDYRKIESALRQLDLIPLQVLIEATIAEVALVGELRYGVEWFFRYGDVAFNFSRLSPSRAPVDTAPSLVTPQLPGFTALFSNADVRAVFNALEDVTDLNVISSPQLLVLDNQTARLQVGDQVPIATQSAVSVTDPDAPVVNSIEQRDTGVILSVTPRVNASGLVTMEIEQEISDVVETTTSEIDSPTIRQRRVASTVAVQSGQTVVLGGLISDEVEQRDTGIPVLHRLPIIGPLFGVKGTTDRRTELLVVLTPRAIRSPDQARAVTEELRQRLRGLVALEERVR
jgi:general secretion pathway protein D